MYTEAMHVHSESYHTLWALRKFDRFSLKLNFNLSTRLRFHLVNSLLGEILPSGKQYVKRKIHGLIKITCITECTRGE